MSHRLLRIDWVPNFEAPAVVYVGHAEPGLADSATGWTIKRISFTGLTLVSEHWTGWRAAKWTDRAIEVYS